ncbi:unnamed protein product [Parajaminaea phylloscopi]
MPHSEKRGGKASAPGRSNKRKGGGPSTDGPRHTQKRIKADPSATQAGLADAEGAAIKGKDARSPKRKAYHAMKQAAVMKHGHLAGLTMRFESMLPIALGNRESVSSSMLLAWEDKLEICQSALWDWPKGPRAATALVTFMKADGLTRAFDRSSWRHRWPLGITKRMWGSLEDVRWLLWCDADEESPEAKYRVAYDYRDVSKKEKGILDAWPANAEDHARCVTFNDRPHPGEAIPRSPLTRGGSGGMLAACYLAVAELHRLDWQFGYLGEDKLEPHEATPRMWSEAIKKACDNCHGFNTIWQGQPDKVPGSPEWLLSQDIAFSAFQQLIKFVWRAMLGSKASNGTSTDCNVRHVYEALFNRLEERIEDLDILWGRLRSFAVEPFTTTEGHGEGREDTGEIEENLASGTHTSDALAAAQEPTPAAKEPTPAAKEPTPAAKEPTPAVEETLASGTHTDALATAKEPTPAVTPKQSPSPLPKKAKTQPIDLFGAPSTIADVQGVDDLSSVPDEDDTKSTADTESDQESTIAIPADQEDLQAFIRDDRPVPAFVLGTRTPFAPLYQPNAHGGMRDILERLGNVTPAIDRNILTKSLILPLAQRSRKAQEDCEGEEEEEDDGDGGTAALADRVPWRSYWHGLSRSQLQQHLRVWVEYAAACPNRSLPADSDIASIRERLQTQVSDSWTLEEYIGLRTHAIPVSLPKGLTSPKTGRALPEKMQLSNQQLESALWFIHKALASRSAGQDAGGCIGDEMGVGKTLQGIVAFLLQHKLKLFGDRPAAVMTKESLLRQWLESFYRFVEAPLWPVDNFGMNTSTNQFSNALKCIPLYLSKKRGMLSSHAGSESLVLIKESKCAANEGGSVNRGVLNTAWGLLLIDEAHDLEQGRVGNLHTPFQKQYLSSGTISFRLLLTGTPMTADLSKQYSLLRSGGNSYTQPDVAEPSTASAWAEAVEAENTIRQTVQSTTSPSAECASIQAALTDAWATYRPKTDDAASIITLLTRLTGEINTLCRLGIMVGTANETLHDKLIPFFRATHRTTLPLADPQPWLLRRFLAPDKAYTPHLFTVRIHPQPEFDAMYRSGTKLLKLLAVSLAGPNANKEPDVHESHYRIASAHPSLLASIEAVMGTPAYADASALPHINYVAKGKELASANEKLIEEGLPLSYIPNRLQREDRVTAAQKRLYAKRNELQREIAMYDAVGFYKTLGIDSVKSRAQLLAGLASPAASALVALISNALASGAGKPLSHPAPAHMFPAKQDRPIKIIIYTGLYATMGFVSHVVRTCGPWAYRHVIKGTMALDEWRDDPNIPILIVTAKDTKGLELQRASVLIFFEVPSKASVQSQAIGRIVRKGQTSDPFVYRIEAAGTYTDRALTLQDGKAAVTSAVDVSLDKISMPLRSLLQPETLELLSSQELAAAVPKKVVKKLSQEYIDGRLRRLIAERTEERNAQKAEARHKRRVDFDAAISACDYARAALRKAQEKKAVTSAAVKKAMDDKNPRTSHLKLSRILEANQAHNAAVVALDNATKTLEQAKAKLASAQAAHRRDLAEEAADAAGETADPHLDSRYGDIFDRSRQVAT